MIKPQKLIDNSVKKTFRTIHYLGSKLRLIDFIQDIVDETDPYKGGICDLFSGSGAVSQHFSNQRKVISVDIQEYSNVICSALLKPCKPSLIEPFLETVMNSEELKSYNDTFEAIIAFEDELINGKKSSDLEQVCDFLDNCSLYSALSSLPNNGSVGLKEVLMSTIKKMAKYDEKSFLITKYFGGVYFSYKQTVTLDVILECIKKFNVECQSTLMSALLSTASDIVNTVGKQFAQPIRSRNKNGEPKAGITTQLRKDRNLDVIEIYTKWVSKYSQIDKPIFNHEVFKMDYLEALDNLGGDIRVVYADPPYTRDHYSRFYHGLETICLKDYPTISTTNIGGVNRLSRGLYREERHQSVFCIKSKAPKAFDELFQKVSEKNLILLLSYSPYDKSKGAHPRVVELETLEELALKYFSSVEVRSAGKFVHNKLNKSELHLESDKFAEVLLVCRN